MKHALGNQSTQTSVSDDSVLHEAIRQWVEVCMLHLEHSQKLADSKKVKEQDHARK